MHECICAETILKCNIKKCIVKTDGGTAITESVVESVDEEDHLK